MPISASRLRQELPPLRVVAVQTRWQSVLARWGLAAKGILYAALGILAINIASGDAASGSATSRNAIQLVANQPLGQVLLVVLTLGLFALAAWQLLIAMSGDPVEGSRVRDRLKYAAKAVLYAGTGLTALAVFTGSRAIGSSGGTGGEARATAEVMSWPAGPWLVALLGIAVVCLGLSQLRTHAWKAQFMERLATSRMRGRARELVERAGRAGYAARGIVFGIAGVFLVVAALQHDPQEAIGLAGALQVLAERSWGQVVLWIVAVGLVLYGLFCFAEARYRRAT